MVKVIHTFASYKTIWKERLYVQMLSALYAKKNLGNIHLYTTEQEAEQINEIGIPYTSIDTSLFSDQDLTLYSLPKLMTYEAQTEPYLHIDCDSIFYDKVDLSLYLNKKSPFFFSHPDVKDFADIKGKLGKHIPLFINNRDEEISSGDYNWINLVYLKLYQQLLHKQDPSVKKYFDFSSIPNMNLVLVKEPEVFAEAVSKSLSHYFKNKNVIDKNEYGPCYIEQLMIHEYLLSLSKQYRKSVKKQKTFFFKNTPLSITRKVQAKSHASIEKTTFPFNFRVNNWCQCCGKAKGTKKYSIDFPEDIKKFFGYNFNGFTHLSFMQWYQVWQVIIINDIVENFGEEYVINAHKYFRKKYQQLNLPLVSEGELMYEKLTGNKIFTEKVVSYKNNAYI